MIDRRQEESSVEFGCGYALVRSIALAYEAMLEAAVQSKAKFTGRGGWGGE